MTTIPIGWLRDPSGLISDVLGWFRVILRPRVTLAVTSGEVSGDVVRRAQQGNHAAFQTIVRHYDDRLRALAFRLLEDRDEMDDALQEVYVKAFQSLGKFKGDSGLGTWLHRITYNVCVDALRKRDNVVPLFAGERPGDVPDYRDPISAAITNVDVAAAVGSLPPDQRTAVLLIDAGGWSYEETGKVLGIPGGTVASRVSRARATLRTSLMSAR